ncbi:MAG TPA: hypothetical protein VMU14_16480 [Acidimicrobiales bacterium]|nr:hypothetical protein [Acidimicrobiales bacterium]
MPEGGLAPGYYPAIGFAAGTVVAWDGRAWHGPLTLPGYYEGPDGGAVWWNGQAWCPDIVAGRPARHGGAPGARERHPRAVGRRRESRRPPAR